MVLKLVFSPDARHKHAKEDKSGWSAFLRHLVDRGLNGVHSDACRGLIESAAEYLPEARWRRCMIHFLPQCLQPPRSAT